MKTKKIILLILSFLLTFSSVYAFSDKIVITATDKTVVATDVPENANLIVGLYKDSKMVTGKFYDGSKTITANYSEDMASDLSRSDFLQAFVWDKDTIEPLTGKLSAKLSDLPASFPTPKVFVDGSEIVFDSAKPFISEGRTLVPVRAVFNALDAQVFWYEKTRSVIAVRDTNLIELNIGSKTALKNNEKITLDVPAQIINSRTVVPLRFVSEALGATVSFDDATKTVYIDTSAAEEKELTADEKFAALKDGEIIFTDSYLQNSSLSGSTKTFSDGICYVNVPKRFDNSYNSQMVLKINDYSFTKGDIMLCSVKARALSAENNTAKFGLVHEQSSGEYKKSISAEYELKVGEDWQTIYLPYTIVIDMESAASHFALRLGYLKQEIEFKDFSLTRYNNYEFEDLPSMNTDYAGREEDAQWRKDAWDRIEQHRKSDFNVSVVTKDGNPVSGADVLVEMTNHEFDFGTTVRENYITSTPANYDTYRKYLSLFFNSAVTEGALKRPSWASDPSRAIYVIDYLADMGLKNLRGHTMVWDRWDKLPSYFETDYAINNPEKMEDETLAHITDIGTAMRGKLADWDVANEIIQRCVMRDILGDETLVKWFKAAKEADPEATLYLNENTVTSINSSNTTTFYELVKKFKSMGAPIEGIGIQAHYNGAISPVDFIKLIEYYSELDCEIKITEFDFQCPDRKLQADFTKDLILAAYSMPEIKGFIMWGFFDGAHWLNDAPLFYSDWTLKESGGAYIKTVFDTLWTNENGKTDAYGNYSGRGFHGEYKVSVTYNGKTYSINDIISNTKDNNFIITID